MAQFSVEITRLPGSVLRGNQQPSACIVVITLLFQIIGDALRDQIDEWSDV